MCPERSSLRPKPSKRATQPQRHEARSSQPAAAAAADQARTAAAVPPAPIERRPLAGLTSSPPAHWPPRGGRSGQAGRPTAATSSRPPRRRRRRGRKDTSGVRSLSVSAAAHAAFSRSFSPRLFCNGGDARVRGRPRREHGREHAANSGNKFRGQIAAVTWNAAAAAGRPSDGGETKKELSGIAHYAQRAARLSPNLSIDVALFNCVHKELIK